MDIDTPTTKPARRRGRPLDDVAIKVRHRLWAWLVYRTANMSWDALDGYWRPQIDLGTPTDSVGKVASRTRTFNRIYRSGSDPAKVRGINGQTLLKAVSFEPKHIEATDLYQSELWILLGSKEPARAWVHDAHQSLMTRLGVAQATGLECSVAQHVGLDHPFVQKNNSQILEQCAYRIADFASCDAIALLGCAFLIAMNRMALQEAHIYLWATIAAAKVFDNRWRTNSGLYNLILWRLVHRNHHNLNPKYVGIRPRQRDRESEENRARMEREFREKFLTMLPSRDLMSHPPMMSHDELPWDFFAEFSKHCKHYVEMDAQRMAKTSDFSIRECRINLKRYFEAESRDYMALKRDLSARSRRKPNP
ncbi:hypothetical protein [Rhodanobacter sp. Soil772]|uniref:hypothetical protein n=1 Tax=Rhodanobacter sp. Soil772 TaxID=1736406 RepID=UPI000ADA7C6A|nr:hypothetical protein [Rhodanobacter sp. Soil772]